MWERSLGALLALSAAGLFGASVPLAKLLLGTIGATTLAGLLYLGAGIGVGLLLAVRACFQSRPTEAPLSRTDWPWLGAVVIAGGIIGPILLMTGLQTTPATSAALLLNLESIFTLLIAWLIFHENVDRRIAVGALTILGGAVALSWQGSIDTPCWGALAVIGACLAWAIDNNLTRRLALADPLIIVTVKGLAAGPITLALAAVLGESFPSASLAIAAGGIGAIGYGGSLIAFVLALRRLGTARTCAYFATAPFIGATLAILLLNEPLTPQLLLATLLMGIGVYLHLTEQHEHSHRHDPLVHTHRHRHDSHHQHLHPSEDPPGEPHSHQHAHAPLQHSHPHYPDSHHRHRHRCVDGSGI